MEFYDAVSSIIGIHDRIVPQVRFLILEVLKRIQESDVTIRDVADIWLDCRLCSCLSNSTIPEQTQIDIVIYCLHYIGIYPTCDIILAMYEFMAIHKKFPSESELIQLLNNQMELLRDAEAYWSKNKLNVPTPNLDFLPTVDAPSDTFCSICQKEIQTNAQVYKMTCCNQYCHYEKGDCLGDSNIINWLSENKKCPMCHQEVLIASPPMEMEVVNTKRQKINS